MDEHIAILKKYIQNSWPDIISKEIEMKLYWTRREGLSMAKEVMWWGSRIVIPSKLQSSTMILLHEVHPGKVRMKKLLARSYFSWSTMDQDIEAVVKGCVGCQENLNTQNMTEYSSWIEPTKPWKRIHIIYAGPYMGKMYLVMMDAYSKWIEVIVMCGTTSKKIVEEMRKIFATHGMPEVIVSDNGTNFISQESKEFMDNNGMKTNVYIAVSSKFKWFS